MSTLTFKIDLPTKELQGLNIPLEVRRDNLCLFKHCLSTEKLEVPPGKYYITARLPAGQEFCSTIEVAEKQEKSVTLISDSIDPSISLSHHSYLLGAFPITNEPSVNKGGSQPYTIQCFVGNPLQQQLKKLKKRIKSEAVSSNDYKFTFSTDHYPASMYIQLAVPGFSPQNMHLCLSEKPLSVRLKLCKDAPPKLDISLPDQSLDLAIHYLHKGMAEEAFQTTNAYQPILSPQTLEDWRNALCYTYICLRQKILNDYLPFSIEVVPEAIRSDFFIIQAEVFASQGKHEQALDALLKVKEYGLPFFSDGLTLIINRLRLYQHPKLAEIQFSNESLKEAETLLRNLQPFACYAQFQQPFVTYTGKNPTKPESQSSFNINPPVTFPEAPSLQNSGKYSISKCQALVFGASTFTDLAAIPSALNDANELYKVLTDEKYCGYLPNQVQYLTQEQATITELRNGLKKLTEQPEANATTLIYLSTHGVHINNNEKQTYLCARDTTVQDLKGTGLSSTELCEYVAQIKTQRIAVIIDACYAEGAIDPNSLFNMIYSDISRTNSRIDVGLMASSRSMEIAQGGNDKELSAFTSHLIVGLQGEANIHNDKYIRFFDLSKYIRDAMSTETGHIPFTLATHSFAIARAYGKRPHNLPVQTSLFLGREQDIEEISTHIFQQRHVAITGIKGIGKSALSTAVVHNIDRKNPPFFSGGITYIRCGNLTKQERIYEIYRKILSDWNISLSKDVLSTARTVEEAIEIRIQALQRYFASHISAPALIILDNFNATDNKEDISLLENLLEQLAEFHITALITTRARFSIANLKLHFLKALSIYEALYLFKTIYTEKGGNWNDQQDDEHCQYIAKTLEYHPLKISHCAMQMAFDNINIAQFKLANIYRYLPQGYHASEEDILLIPRRTLNIFTITTQTYFAMLGMVPITDYPVSVIKEMFRYIDPNMDAMDTIKRFHTYSLLTYRDDINRIRLQPILHELAEEKWNELDQQTKIRAIDGLIRGFIIFANMNMSDLFLDEQTLLETIKLADKYQCDKKELTDLTRIAGDYFYQQGRWDYYENVLQVQRKVYTELNQQEGKCQTLYAIGKLKNTQGQHKDAKKILKESLQIARHINHRKSIYEALLSLGYVSHDLGHYNNALTYYEKALALAYEHDEEDTKSEDQQSEVLLMLGSLAQDRGQYENARIYYKRSRDAATNEKTQKKVQLSSVCLALDQGLWKKAQRDIQSLYQKGDYTITAFRSNSLLIRGRLAHLQNNESEAFDNYDKALEIAEFLRRDANKSQILLHKGKLYQDKKEYQKARECYDLSLDIAEKIQRPSTHGDALLHLGSLDIELGNCASAQQNLENALSIFQTIGQRAFECEGHFLLGNCASKQKQYDEATQHYLRALKLARSIRQLSLEGKILYSLGDVYQKQKDKRHIYYYRAAVFILNDINDSYLETLRKNLPEEFFSWE
jgi:tetratricopeptide (TPR) repeat protein